MSLPARFQNLFSNKQRSYKMVLILSLIEESKGMPKPVALTALAQRFQNYYINRERKGSVVEPPPKEARHWADLSKSNIRSLILANPMPRLSKILAYNKETDMVSFQPEAQKELTAETLNELKKYAEAELSAFYQTYHPVKVSLKPLFLQIMDNYLKAKRETFSGHPLGALVRQRIPQELQKLPFIGDNYKVQGSVGMGNWATIPWIAIMDKRITQTTRRGEYVVYLFAEDMQSVYLTLAQGVTVPREKYKQEADAYLRKKASQMRSVLPLAEMHKDENIYLTSSGLGRDYQVSTVAYLRYDRENMPSDAQLVADLENVMENYGQYVELELERGGHETDEETKIPERTDTDVDKHGVDKLPQLTVKEQIESIKAYIEAQGFTYSELMIPNFYLSLKTKPFVILAGVSGTGKTKLIRLFAEALGATSENGRFALIPVRPDWSDPSDLLGYRDLSGVFRPGKLTQVFRDASLAENRDKPYFVCLDEMNLARVEHYFSDVLSLLETQHWHNDHIVTNPILSTQFFQDNDLEEWGELKIPDNVYLIGTVNMDETTYPFSKKVLDRASTIEFNAIDLRMLPATNGVGDIAAKPNNLSVDNTLLRSDYLILADVYRDEKLKPLIERTVERLVQINEILEEVHAQVGFRVRDSICFYLAYNARYGLLTEEEAFDLQVLQKILPRVQGSNLAVKRVLIELMFLATGFKENREEMLEDASPLYLPWGRAGKAPEVHYPHTARKLAFMLRRFEEDGFTSFWLS